MRLPSITITIMALAMAAVLLVTAKGAAAAGTDTPIVIEGKVSGLQDGEVELNITQGGRVDTGVVGWTARCKGAPLRFNGGTAIKPLGRQAPGTMKLNGTYRSRQKAYRFKIAVKMTGFEKPIGGEEPAETTEWRGRFSARAVISKNGRRIATCPTKKGLRWRAHGGVPSASGVGSGHFVLDGSPGDKLTDGNDVNLTSPPARIAVTGNRQEVSASIDSGTVPWWHIHIRGTNDALLPAGVPLDTGSGDSPYGLFYDASGDHLCSGIGTSHAFIVSIEFDHYNRLVGLDLGFDVRCNTGSGTVTGRLTWKNEGYAQNRSRAAPAPGEPSPRFAEIAP